LAGESGWFWWVFICFSACLENFTVHYLI
jgi:hypothetical protein